MNYEVLIWRIYKFASEVYYANCKCMRLDETKNMGEEHNAICKYSYVSCKSRQQPNTLGPRIAIQRRELFGENGL